MTEQTLGCSEARLSLGVLVLGALEPSDREQVEAHVRGCPRCSATLAELAPVPGLLNRVDTADIDPEPPPPELLDRVLAVVRAEERQHPGRWAGRRRWAWVSVGVAAAACVAVGAVVWTQSTGGRTPDPGSVVAVASDPSSTVSAQVTLTPTATGTELALALSGVPAEQHCQLVAVGRDGTREVAATWVATYDGEAHVTGWTGLLTDQIASLEITTPDGATLATMTVPAGR